MKSKFEVASAIDDKRLVEDEGNNIESQDRSSAVLQGRGS